MLVDGGSDDDQSILMFGHEGVRSRLRLGHDLMDPGDHSVLELVREMAEVEAILADEHVRIPEACLPVGLQGTGKNQLVAAQVCASRVVGTARVRPAVGPGAYSPATWSGLRVGLEGDLWPPQRNPRAS